MIDKDIESLKVFKEKSEKLRITPFMDFNNYSDMMNVFWLCLPLCFAILPNYPSILFSGELKFDELAYWWFWTMMFLLSGYCFFSRIIKHIKGNNHYKKNKSNLNLLQLEKIFEKYEFNKKIKRSNGYTAWSNNQRNATLLMNKLIESQKIIQRSAK